MRKTIATLLLMLCATAASADDCPDFYRFVDFGIEGGDGVIYRGGPVLRAESFAGDPILLNAQTKCLPVRDISADGHGNPIPVVTAVNYDPAQTDIDLSDLRVMIAQDAEAMAEKNASAHRATLENADAMVTQGEDFLCARSKGSDDLSCQLVSPYPGNIALVVYCDASHCRMPALAITERLVVAAVWDSNADIVSAPETAGPLIIGKVQQIHDFLDPLSSAF